LILLVLSLLEFLLSLKSSFPRWCPGNLFSRSKAFTKFFKLSLISDRLSLDFDNWYLFFLLWDILVIASLATLAISWRSWDLRLAQEFIRWWFPINLFVVHLSWVSSPVSRTTRRKLLGNAKVRRSQSCLRFVMLSNCTVGDLRGVRSSVVRESSLLR